jgi:hypothetical protein
MSLDDGRPWDGEGDLPWDTPDGEWEPAETFHPFLFPFQLAGVPFGHLGIRFQHILSLFLFGEILTFHDNEWGIIILFRQGS